MINRRNLFMINILIDLLKKKKKQQTCFQMNPQHIWRIENYKVVNLYSIFLLLLWLSYAVSRCKPEQHLRTPTKNKFLN